jgi:acyl carrier protein
MDASMKQPCAGVSVAQNGPAATAAPAIAPPQPAASPTIDRVRQTWAEVLDLDAVGPDDDFFEIGGNSVIVASAVARLGARFGIDLPLRAVFEAPTPAEMAELIDERLESQEREPSVGFTPFFPDWVIPLQREGSGRPVFVFPAGHDEMRALTIDAQIAAHVGRDHPFWGLRRVDPHLERLRAEGIPMLAAEYVAQMQRIQEEGPYLLFATCAGGYLAWEVASRFLAAGEAIAGILFFEVPLGRDFDKLIPGQTPAHTARPWELSLAYRPRPLPVDLTHILTDDWAARGWGDPWQRVALGSFETVIIPVKAIGTQAYLARRQEIIAEHVRRWIEKAEDE